MRNNTIAREKPQALVSALALYIFLYSGVFFWSMPRTRPKGYIIKRGVTYATNSI